MQNNFIKNVMENSYEPSYSIIYEYNDISEIEDSEVIDDYGDSSNEDSLDEDEEIVDHSDLVWLPGIEEVAES